MRQILNVYDSRNSAHSFHTLTMEPLPALKQGKHKRQAGGSNCENECNLYTRHICFNDGWNLVFRESHSDLSSARCNYHGRINVWGNAREDINQFVDESCLCRIYGKGSTNGLSNYVVSLLS
jgi:hypothetical protein